MVQEYLASFPSSWDEFVIEMRYQSGLEGSDVQFELFYSKGEWSLGSSCALFEHSLFHIFFFRIVYSDQ